MMMRSPWPLFVLFLFAASIPVAAQPTLTSQQQAEVTRSNKLNDDAVALHAAGKASESLPLGLEVLTIRARVLGPEHPLTAVAHANLGTYQKDCAQYAEAHRSYEQALQIRRKLYGEEHADTASTLFDLGVLSLAQGDFAAARKYYTQSLAIRLKVRGEEHQQTAQTLNSLGSLEWQRADYAAARPYYERALKIQLKVLGREHRDTAQTINNLATTLHLSGDYPGARSYYEQALAIRKKVLGESHPVVGASLNNLGALLQDQGSFTAARPYFEQALQIQRKAHGNNHPETALALNNLGSLTEAIGDRAAARRYYEESLLIRKSVYQSDHPLIATSYNNLGRWLQAESDVKAARWNYDQALAIQLKILGENHPETATTLNNLGTLAEAQGDIVAARGFYERAHRSRVKVLGEFHPVTTQMAANRIGLEASAGNWRIATELAERSRRNSFQQVAHALVGLSDKEQLAFLMHQDTWLFHTALSLPLSSADEMRLNDLSAGWLLNGKAVAHQALASRSLLSRDASNPGMAKIVADLTAVRRELAGHVLKAAKPGDEETYQTRLSKLTADEQRLERELAAANGQTPSSRNWLTVDALRQSLPDDTIYIDIMRFQLREFQLTSGKKRSPPAPHYVAWIIPAKGRGDVKIVDLGLAEPIEITVHQARRSLAAVTELDGLLKQKGETLAESVVRKDLARVADLVWKPLAAHIGDSSNLVVSPDGVLWFAPWPALPVNDNRYLIEQYAISFVNSGRDIVAETKTTVATNKPAIFANPDYDLNSDAVRAATKAVFPNIQFDLNQTRGLVSQSALPKVTRLPFTAIEEQGARPSIEKLTGNAPLVYTESYALESIAKRVHRPKLLFFATHGFFLPDQEQKSTSTPLPAEVGPQGIALSTSGKPIENPLLRCGLLLTGCNVAQATGGDDGILTGLEIVGLDLRGTELVVLSACETGIGKVRNGEGVAGLRQAFQLAGAQSVVSTLWQVPDRDSAIIMQDFFTNLAAGQTKADALRNAQLKRIEARKEKSGAAHPFFWAAWTVTGD